jgi:hypothetical protein
MSSAEMLLHEPQKRRRYFDENGKSLPGVTTIIAQLDKPALLDWASRAGEADMRSRAATWLREHAEMPAYEAADEIERALEITGAAHRRIRDTAADVGTCTHHRCEAHLRGMIPEEAAFPPEIWTAATRPTDEFRRWWDASGLVVVLAELAITDTRRRFGGTIDIVARDAFGRGLIVDLKTSWPANPRWGWRGTVIYEAHVLQVAAYTSLCRLYLHDPVIHGAIILSLPQEGGLTTVTVDRFTLAEAEKVFEHLLDIYWRRRELNNER